MNDDATLLRRYADEGSEAAFTELVRRHVDLVYGAALRRTGGDAHRSADVAQQVFTRLARHARKLSRHTALGAWLHTATRNAALNLMISEKRRQARETEALALHPAGASGGTSPDWERLRPLLDAAIDELPEADRAAVVLRFLEHHPFARIGEALRVSEDAARMRTERALEKLRAALARRGVTSTAAALGMLVSSQPVVSAPAGLVATLAVQSMAAAGPGIFVSTLFSFMSTKIIATAALSALAAFIAGTHFASSPSAGVAPPPPASEAPPQGPTLASLRQDNQRLNAEVQGLIGEVGRLKETNAALAEKLATPASTSAAAAKDVTLGLAKWEVQQATLNNLRQIDAARRQFQIEKGQFAGSIHELVGRRSYIKALRTVAGENYSGLSMNPAEPLTVTTPSGLTVTYDPAGVETTRPEVPPEVARAQELTTQVRPLIEQAFNAYRAANPGKNPPNEQALLPYFSTPKDGADFVEYLEAKKAAGL